MTDPQGIGLPLDEAVVFWRRMYGATMSDDKFNKEYKYNIRHSYGQEGKRTNYAPKRYVLFLFLFFCPCFYLPPFLCKYTMAMGLTLTARWSRWVQSYD